MKVSTRVVISMCVICLASGCSALSGLIPTSTDAQAGDPAVSSFASASVAGTCEALGVLTARADCNCYDKMSYDRVRGEATENLYREAQTSYPESNLVEISSVNLYLNRAVAKGTAYRCPSVSSY